MNLGRRLDRLVQAALAPGAVSYLSARLGEIAGAINGPVLDVGCGYASPLQAAGIAAIGLDIDAPRAAAYGRRAPAVVADATALPFADASFAAAFSFGLLHHLADVEARRAIVDMRRVTRVAGLIVIFDGVRPGKTSRPLAAAIRALDPGGHMRAEAEFLALFDGIPRWRHERVTYAATGLEGLWCIRPPTG